VLGIGGIWFQRAQRKLELESQEKQRQRELEVQDQHAQDAALQSYLHYIGQLLLDKDKVQRSAANGIPCREYGYRGAALYPVATQLESRPRQPKEEGL
jgi:hypothetical protein